MIQLKKIIQFTSKALWLSPFITFLMGYYLIHRFFVTNQIEVPSVIGLTLNEASRILSDHNLNLRILSQKEDSDLPDGTIIDQNPIRQKTKTNKPVYLVVSRKFREFKMPDFKGKDLKEIEKIIQKLNIKSKNYFLENNAKENICICQYPEPGKSIDKNEKIFLYISSGNKKPVLIPNFKGYKLTEIIDFLNLYEIKPIILVSNLQKYDSNKNYKIIDQRPIPGSIIQLNKNFNIQLQVEEINN